MKLELTCPCCGNKFVFVDGKYELNVCEQDETTLAAMIKNAGYEFGEQKGGEKE